jgi:hypothetical protein
MRRLPGMIGRERMWKLESWITGVLGAFVAQVLIRAISDDPQGQGPICGVRPCQ